MTNRLGDAASAYLQSASHQPIHWHPWGAEAFAEAAREDRPVLLDIGAVWCHWCHVMDGESYEDPALAEFLNEHFVCIKVDRDERPDVDARYQRAVQAMIGQGGWPLTAFLTPAGEVFYGGTYFPPDGKYGRPGFRAVLEQVRKVYHTQRDKVASQSLAVRRMLAEQLDEAAPGEPTTELLAGVALAMARHFDPTNGGFGSQPKFPHPAAVSFLLQRWYDVPGEESWAREVADKTLLGMTRGGIHDQLAGGFHRYSVDARWVVPHFEKMSYDNAELLKAYLDGWLALGDTRYAETARGIVRWVREVLADPEGGYGASQDADVGLHDDGDYFTWTVDEARAAIGDAEAFEVACLYYDIGTAGEMHHDPAKNVLFIADTVESIAQARGTDPATVTSRLTLAQERMRAARATRTTPFVDRTRYTGWNGMLAGALIRAGVLLGEPWALQHGLRSLARLRSEQQDPVALAHAPGGVKGLLDDQVQVALAALEAHEATADGQWLAWAAAILDRVWAEYLDPAEGGLFDAAAASGEGLLPTRAKPVQDAPTPSPNGVAGLCLARLAELTGAPRFAERRDALLRAFAGAVPQLGLYGATIAQALAWGVSPATHLVIVEGGEAGGSELADAMYRAALETFVPRRVIQRYRAGATGEASLPAAVRGMLTADGETRGYVCTGTACQAPATTLDAWRANLGQFSPV
jgi:hypothetical protein